MEHRWGERVAVDITVRLASKPYTVRTGRITDLSMSGANIEVALDLRVLSRIQVAIILPSRFSHPTPVIAAYVARRHREGVGVEWCDFAPQAVADLLRSSAAIDPLRRLQRAHTPPPLMLPTPLAR
ncbi:MAG TPA: PilZ domain-containing protein [Steroidobacteraceae bacterium]|jgi:hypothetical protein|nr:PilZ domain-containing protein [Steroidobacteraceae bacterium]